MKLTLVIPVYNEERRLAASLPRLLGFMQGMPAEWDWEVVIANNGSTDGTQRVAEDWAQREARLRMFYRAEKGRGGALKQAWLMSPAEVLAYMDVDLSTDLVALPALVKAVAEGGWDLAVGSRHLAASRVQRGWKREMISRVYAALVRGVCSVKLSDVQCGFKALNQAAARALLPQVEDRGWFFDTELLVLAARQGWRILELPVNWTEDGDSRVRLCSTAWADFQGLWRLRRRG